MKKLGMKAAAIALAITGLGVATTIATAAGTTQTSAPATDAKQKLKDAQAILNNPNATPAQIAAANAAIAEVQTTMDASAYAALLAEVTQELANDNPTSDVVVVVDAPLEQAADPEPPVIPTDGYQA